MVTTQRSTWKLSPVAFDAAAHKILYAPRGRSQMMQSRRFRVLFGVTSQVCATVWNYIGKNIQESAMPEHQLWALLLLEVYATDHVNSQIAQADEKTFCKCAGKFIEMMANMNFIK